MITGHLIAGSLTFIRKLSHEEENKALGEIFEALNYLQLNDNNNIKKDFLNYIKVVAMFTNRTITSKKQMSNIRIFENEKVDYYITVKDGFLWGIEPHIIGSKHNLRVKKQHEDQTKRGESLLSKTELELRYYREKGI